VKNADALATPQVLELFEALRTQLEAQGGA